MVPSYRSALDPYRVTAPLFVKAGTGINDDLNGVERPGAATTAAACSSTGGCWRASSPRPWGAASASRACACSTCARRT